jgi:Domain of unknown function (DUF4926)
MLPIPQMLDVVALLENIPEQGLLRGEIGTIVEVFADACEVEFVDKRGQTYAMLPLQTHQFITLRLHRTPLEREVESSL